jgi:acyl carrier protein
MDELKTIIRQAAGEVEAEVPGRDFADTTYADLGYDSLAVLEVSARIAQLFGVSVPDGGLDGQSTPDETVRLVNSLVATPATT